MFWKPGTKAPASAQLGDVDEDRQTEQEGGLNMVYNKYAQLSMDQQRKQLPVHKVRNEILYCVEKHKGMW